MSEHLNDGLPDVMKTIKTRPLFVFRLDVRPLQIVGGPEGSFRRIGVVPGGVFEGERLSGKVLEGGSDWQLVRSDQSVSLNVRLVLETGDGALIGVTYQGVRAGAPEILKQIDAGDEVDPASYYFRINPLFETASEKYRWLNNIVAVGAGRRTAAGPVYSVFEVL